MSTKSKAKGTAAEREVVRYLQQWWPGAERRALSGAKDKGDVAGIPGVVVEVKAAQRLELAKWKSETMEEKLNAGARACVLVVKRSYKSVSEWDAHIPTSQLWTRGEGDPGWTRMDLHFAAVLLRRSWEGRKSPLVPYLSTME